MQDYVTPLPLALVVAIHAGALLALISILRAPTEAHPGWRHVRPGATHWFCFLGSWVFAGVMTWVWLFVGSDRQDAGTQMIVALLLMLGFGGFAVVSGWRILRMRRSGLHWRGETIRWRDGGRLVEQAMGDLDAVRRGWSETLQFRFRDGGILTLDLHARGAEDLAGALSEAFRRDVD